MNLKPSSSDLWVQTGDSLAYCERLKALTVLIGLPCHVDVGLVDLGLLMETDSSRWRLIALDGDL